MSLISAHRGGTEGHRPGTRAAYERSIAAGAELIEFDVRATRDGQYICHHDSAIPGLGAIAHWDFASITAHDPEIVTLAEVLQLAADRSICHIDLKETGYEDAVVQLALRIVGPDRMIVTSLEDVSIAHVRERYPDVKAALSLGRDTGGLSLPQAIRARVSELIPFQRLARCGANGVAVNHRLATWLLLRYARRSGLLVMVWTLNTDGLIQRFLQRPDVDVVVTDTPIAATRLRAALVPH